MALICPAPAVCVHCFAAEGDDDYIPVEFRDEPWMSSEAANDVQQQQQTVEEEKQGLKQTGKLDKDKKQPQQQGTTAAAEGGAPDARDEL
jgi:hypothetical protein